MLRVSRTPREPIGLPLKRCDDEKGAGFPALSSRMMLICLAVRELVDDDVVHRDVLELGLALLVLHDINAGDRCAEVAGTRLTAVKLNVRPAVAETLVRAVSAAKELRACVGVDIEAR